MAFPFTGRIEILWLLIVQTVYVYYFVLRLRKGLPRLLGLLPLLAASLVVPWRAQTTSERLVCSFFFLWMINTKLLLLAWDTGPAADPSSLSSLPRFFFALTSTLHLKRDQQVFKWKPDAVKDGSSAADTENGRNGYSKRGSDGSLAGNKDGSKPRSKSGSDGLASGPVRRKSTATDDDGKLHGHASEMPRKGPIPVPAKKGGLFGWVQMIVTSQAGRIVLLRSIFYFIVEMCLLRMMREWKHLMSKYVLVFAIGFYVYFGCLFVFEGLAAIPACLLGVQLHPQFNMPYLADSLADFWGRRWNLLVNNLLRVSIYEPVLGLLNGRTKPTARERAASTAVTFLVSGLMHELFIFYASRMRPSWELTAFFVLNGAGTIFEGFVRIKTRGQFRLPRLLTWAYTFSFVYFSAYWLFCPPLIRTGVLDATLDDVRGFIDWALGAIIIW